MCSGADSRRRLHRCQLRVRLRQLEAQREPRALTRGALALNRCVVLAHDAIGDRKAQASALADGLRREEGS